LSEADIEKMVQEAEAHKEDDKLFEQLVTTRNQADQLIHGIRKQVEEAGEALSVGDKAMIEQAITELEVVKSGNDKDAIDGKVQALTQAAQNLMEIAQQRAQTQSAETQSQQNSQSDDVVDAEFEEVK
jgi:molecular chaperone DnaK